MSDLEQEKLLTALKSHTLSSVYNNEKVRLPIIVSNRNIGYNSFNSKITVEKQFHYDNRWFSYKYSIDEPQYTFGIIKVNNIPYRSFKNKSNKKSFIASMNNLLYQGYCEPFMVFVNGRFVNWNYINIVFDCNDTYILLYGEKYNWYNLSNSKIDIVFLPFKIDYTGVESDQYFDMMYEIYKSYLQDSVSFTEDNKSSITVPGIDEIYEYKGMIYNIGAWIYTQLKYSYLDLLSPKRLSKLKNVDIYQYSYDKNGNKIQSYYTKFNTFDKDSYSKSIYDKICYSNIDKYISKAMIRFNEDGYESQSGQNILSLINSEVKVFKSINPSDKYFSKLALDNQIFRENILVFNNGEFNPYKDLDINYDIIYNNDSNYNHYSFYIIYYTPIEQVLNHLNNHFSKNFFNEYMLYYTKSSNENKRKYISDSVEPLDFSYSNDKTYEDNKSDALNKIIKYDATLLNSLYKTNIESKVFTGREANKLMTDSYNKYNKHGLYITRSKYEDHESYIMVFEDGELLKEYSNMIVSSNYFYIPMERNFAETSDIELLYFNKINNNEIEFDASSRTFNNDNTVNIDAFSKIINQDELKIFNNYPRSILKYKDIIETNMLYKDHIAFNISYKNNNNELSIMPSKEKEKYVAVSSRKFIYQKLSIDQKAYRIKIGKRFRYCDNQKQYILFINGRRMNDESFLITIPKHSRPFWGMYLYTAKFVSPEDRIELFYVPEEIIDINVNNKSELNNNGYIYTDKNILTIPYDPRLYMIFINGRKISENNIIAINSYTFKITKDYQSTDNLMICPICNNEISYISEYMANDELDKYDSLINYIRLNFDEDELNKVFNSYIEMSDTDVSISRQNVQKIAILNEIIRDFWISSGYAYNENTFIYDYELLLDDMNLSGDVNPFYVLPALDATQAKNIIKNELYLKSFNYYINNNELVTSGNFEIGSTIHKIYFQWEYIDPQNSFANEFNILKQSIQYGDEVYDINYMARSWALAEDISKDITIKFSASTSFRDISKNINVKFVNGIFYGNIDENNIKELKNEYLKSDNAEALIPKNGIVPSMKSQSEETKEYTTENYSVDNILESDLIMEVDSEESIEDKPLIINKYSINDLLSTDTLIKSLQDSPELVLEDYSFGNNNYFIYACPTRLAFDNKNNQLLEFIMPDINIDNVIRHCRDDKTTPIYTSGSWDDITNHNLFEILDKMEMIYLGDFLYINSSGYKEFYSVWRSNGYFTRLFDKYKFDKVIIRFKDNSKTITLDND